MGEPVQWSKNPELWAFRSKRLKLHAAIDRARSARFLAQKAHIEREYARLQQRWRQLAEDARFAKTRKDPRTMRRLAEHIAAFYQEVGMVEGRVDAILDEVAAFNDLGTRTG